MPEEQSPKTEGKNLLYAVEFPPVRLYVDRALSDEQIRARAVEALGLSVLRVALFSVETDEGCRHVGLRPISTYDLRGRDGLAEFPRPLP